MDVPPILVYKFKEAPSEYRELSTCEGNEDWLAVVPAEVEERHYIGWLDEGTRFGNHVERHELDDGTAIYIGAQV